MDKNEKEKKEEGEKKKRNIGTAIPIRTPLAKNVCVCGGGGGGGGGQKTSEPFLRR